MTLLVGLLDSGAGAVRSDRVAEACRFQLDDAGEVVTAPAEDAALGHGAALAGIILASAPTVRLLDAQVFAGSRATAPAVVAAGLDWLVAEGARLVTMSFGMRYDRAVLRRACTAAVEAGTILLAAAPARGSMVYPAGYPDVVRVSGDARCAPGEVSALGTAQADFGAYPHPLQVDATGRPIGGASYAVAHLCAVLAVTLADCPAWDRAAALAHLARIARYHGPERRDASLGA